MIMMMMMQRAYTIYMEYEPTVEDHFSSPHIYIVINYADPRETSENASNQIAVIINGKILLYIFSILNGVLKSEKANADEKKQRMPHHKKLIILNTILQNYYKLK